MLNNVSISDYINQNFCNLNNYNDALKYFEDLKKFFFNNEITYDFDLLADLINDNSIFNDMIKLIYEHYNKDIILKNLDRIFNNSLLTSAIETYCVINNIEIEKQEDYDVDYDSVPDSYMSDDINLYFNEIKRIPLLSLEQEKEVALQVMNGSQEARKTLIESNLKLVVSIARRYLGSGVSLLDLIQEGNIGLMKAVERFDVTKGYKFSTYAIWWIRQTIKRSFHGNINAINIPVHTLESMNKLHSIQRKLTIELGHEPTNEDLAREMNISVDRVRELFILGQGTVSLETPVGEDDSQLSDFIPNEDSSIDDIVFYKDLPSAIQKVFKMCNLSKKEVKILTYRFGLQGEEQKTLEEIGQMFGVTRERIRQIETKALRKIRNSRYKEKIKSYI